MEKSPVPAPGKMKTPNKLVLTNQNKGRKTEHDKFVMPATFTSNYAAYMVNQQN